MLKLFRAYLEQPKLGSQKTTILIIIIRLQAASQLLFSQKDFRTIFWMAQNPP